jgi:hypothetical protein
MKGLHTQTYFLAQKRCFSMWLPAPFPMCVLIAEALVVFAVYRISDITIYLSIQEGLQLATNFLMYIVFTYILTEGNLWMARRHIGSSNNNSLKQI